MGRLFRFLGIFDIVSSDLCLILSNLRAVQSVSQFVKKNLLDFQKEGGSKAFLTMLKKTARLVERDIPNKAQCFLNV